MWVGCSSVECQLSKEKVGKQFMKRSSLYVFVEILVVNPKSEVGISVKKLYFKVIKFLRRQVFLRFRNVWNVSGCFSKRPGMFGLSAHKESSVVMLVLNVLNTPRPRFGTGRDLTIKKSKYCIIFYYIYFDLKRPKCLRAVLCITLKLSQNALPLVSSIMFCKISKSTDNLLQ